MTCDRCFAGMWKDTNEAWWKCHFCKGTGNVIPRRPYRVKLIVPADEGAMDAHYFYAESLPEAREMAQTLTEEIGTDTPTKVYIYVDTTLGHVRIA